MRRLWQDIVAPRSWDEKNAHKEFLLNITSLVMGGLSLLSVPISGAALARGVGSLPFLLLGIATAAVCYLAYRLGRRGHVTIGGYIPPLLVWATATGVLAAGGWYTGVAVGYVLATALATLLGGLVEGIVVGGLSLIAYGVMGQRFFAGALPQIFPPPEELWVFNTVVLGMTLGAACALFYVFDRQLIRSSAQRMESLRHYAEELERSIQEREQLVQQLQETGKRQEQLTAAMRAVSAPVLPLFEGLIVVPLVGRIDPQRAELLLDDLLRGIAQYKADHVLLDVTGLSSVDRPSAQSLVQAVSGARMLGSECRLVGVQPAVAQQLASLDVDLSAIGSYSTLREGLADFLSHTHGAVQGGERGSR